MAAASGLDTMYCFTSEVHAFLIEMVEQLQEDLAEKSALCCFEWVNRA